MTDLEFSEVFGGDAVGNRLGNAVSDDELFADLGMIDPYTGTPIVTKADFLAWKERFWRKGSMLPRRKRSPRKAPFPR